ncbi:putative pyruvate, phosphate dikinase regulatory protein [Philodulcilactobacillus myokoensis]|uniref:Putative pyruvate, phosphate dikinase regulatory protein n=1 Tax=Philodulcilactobacillus myokoensis TaxID=2929573 RepID=A0A9W6B114_9LACO|nr:pyruvate, water dikinase regulatory protein [Philodulcilactobacillus myokoensis]GLB46915.1 putative pyruvate, phosphate dikinase regulatory protein [Philodulcilactobacillus myokoensis]
MDKLNIFIISDASGQTALTVAKTAASQFQHTTPNYQRFTYVTEKESLKNVLKQAEKSQSVIFHTLTKPEMSKIVIDFAKKHHLLECDCIQKPITMLAKQTGMEPEYVPNLVHNLNSNYFNRISAMEFAVVNDDGKNPQNLSKADIVILGVSRTSKTPLSLYLANNNFKVANVPINPKIQLPDQVWDIDKNKIFGLTNTVKSLKKIRRERMRSYGMNLDTPYSNSKNIKAELEYAKNLYKKIGCRSINVSNKSIEETATIIMSKLGYSKIKN